MVFLGDQPTPVTFAGWNVSLDDVPQNVAPRPLGVFLVGSVHVGAGDLEIDRRSLLRLAVRMENPQRFALVTGMQARLFAGGVILQVPHLATPKNPITVHVFLCVRGWRQTIFASLVQ